MLLRIQRKAGDSMTKKHRKKKRGKSIGPYGKWAEKTTQKILPGFKEAEIF